MERDRLKMRLTFVCLLMCIKTVRGSFPISLRNVAVVAGQRMEMKCRTDNGTNIRQWTLQRISLRKSDNEQIWSNWKEAPNRKSKNFTHFGIEMDAGDSGLIYANKTRLEDAGLYTCAVQYRENTQLTSYSAHLIVFESEPNCVNSRNGTFLTRFQCTVVFRGHLKPSMQWKLHCNNDSAKQDGAQELADELIFYDSEKSTFTSGINITFDWESNSCYVSCKTLFEWQNSSSNANTATNAPAYSYIWSAASEGSWNSNANSSTVTISTHNKSANKQATTVDHKTDGDYSPKTAVLVVALVVACLIAVVCGCCCVVCMCFRRKFSDMMFRLANVLQGGRDDTKRRTIEANCEENSNCFDGAVNSAEDGSLPRGSSRRTPLPQIPRYEQTTKTIKGGGGGGEASTTQGGSGSFANGAYDGDSEDVSTYARLSREIDLGGASCSPRKSNGVYYSVDPICSNNTYNIKRFTLTTDATTTTTTTTTGTTIADNTYATVTSSIYETTTDDDVYSDIKDDD